MQDWDENLQAAPTDGHIRLQESDGPGLRDSPWFRYRTGAAADPLPAFADSLYDIVLVTTGFADETTIGDFAATSYWVSDDIARRTADDVAL